MEDKQENLTAWLMFGLLAAFAALLVGIHVMLSGGVTSGPGMLLCLTP